MKKSFISSFTLSQAIEHTRPKQLELIGKLPKPFFTPYVAASLSVASPISSLNLSKTPVIVQWMKELLWRVCGHILFFLHD